MKDHNCKHFTCMQACHTSMASHGLTMPWHCCPGHADDSCPCKAGCVWHLNVSGSVQWQLALVRPVKLNMPIWSRMWFHLPGAPACCSALKSSLRIFIMRPAMPFSSSCTPAHTNINTRILGTFAPSMTYYSSTRHLSGAEKCILCTFAPSLTDGA